jgi:tetratricopeptide (TPR) repeat protein
MPSIRTFSWIAVRVCLVALAGASLPARPAGAAPARARLAAAAEPSEAEQKARAHYAQGEAAFHAGRYEEAAAEFEAGFAAMPRPGFLLNIGHSQRRLGNLRKARAAYKKFLLVDPGSKMRPEVESLIAELDSAIADEDHGEHAAAAATTPPAQPPPRLDAPSVTATGTASGAALVPGPVGLASIDRAPGPAPLYKRPWFWAAVGAVAVGAAAGVYFWQRSPDDGFRAMGSLGAVKP